MSLFVSEYASVDMAAVSYEGKCYCFSIDMLHPIQTEEEKYQDAINKAARDYCGRIGIGEISVVAFKVGAQWQKEYKQP